MRSSNGFSAGRAVQPHGRARERWMAVVAHMHRHAPSGQHTPGESPQEASDDGVSFAAGPRIRIYHRNGISLYRTRSAYAA
jgi:hypothetical protein